MAVETTQELLQPSSFSLRIWQFSPLLSLPENKNQSQKLKSLDLINVRNFIFVPIITAGLSGLCLNVLWYVHIKCATYTR